MESSPLEIKFSVELLKRTLEETSKQAQKLALTYFELFSALAIKHQNFGQTLD